MSGIEWFAIFALIAHIVIGFAAAVAVSVNRRPAAAIAWILLIIFAPFLGVIVFFLVGFGRLPKRRREKQREVCNIMLERDDVLARSTRPTSPPWLASAVRLNENLGSLPMLSGSSTQLIPGYTDAIDAMVADIDAAREYVHVEFYILVHDAVTAPFFEALARACQRGVTVRVLSDHVSGLMLSRRRETRDALEQMGALWKPMLPLNPLRGQWQRPDMRNHRKLIIIDGIIGHTGSLNMIADDYNKPKNISRGLHWLELQVRLEGPVVAELDAVFVTDWYSETDELLAVAPGMARSVVTAGTHVDAQVVPSGPSFENDNNLKLFVQLIHSAQHRISITSPYFVPEEATLLALITAASRGVEVELFVSEIGDQKLVYHAQRSYYEVLLRAGVRIFLYQAPTVLHAKHFSVDEDVAIIGTSNMDIRSFSLNMEVSLLVRSAAFVSEMRRVEDDYRANSTELLLEQWMQRPLGEKVVDSLARLTSSLQ